MSKKVLIVEDNPSNLKLIKFVLGDIECEVLEARDGEEALKVAKESKPGLILMDVQIPKIDGLEVTRRLRAMSDFKETPIIMLTAFAMEKDEKRGVEAGCTEYLAKPFNVAKFTEVVKKYL